MRPVPAMNSRPQLPVHSALIEGLIGPADLVLETRSGFKLILYWTKLSLGDVLPVRYTE